jgi:hypothetical protein
MRGPRGQADARRVRGEARCAGRHRAEGGDARTSCGGARGAVIVRDFVLAPKLGPPERSRHLLNNINSRWRRGSPPSILILHGIPRDAPFCLRFRQQPLSVCSSNFWEPAIDCASFGACCRSDNGGLASPSSPLHRRQSGPKCLRTRVRGRRFQDDRCALCSGKPRPLAQIQMPQSPGVRCRRLDRPRRIAAASRRAPARPL